MPESPAPQKNDMPPDIQDVLAYEIKKEMADRYFGFRKLIDEDKMDLAEKTRQYVFILEKRISFDLIRLYIMLRDEERIRTFLEMTGIEERLFYDPYLTESLTIRQRVFQGVRLHGFTRAGRFENLFRDCYERLATHIVQSHEKSRELAAARELIDEEIGVFARSNDLGSILGFLRALGSDSRGALAGGLEPGIAAALEKKMAIAPAETSDLQLPSLPLLPSLGDLGRPVRDLIRAAYAAHQDDFPDSYITPARACDGDECAAGSLPARER